MVGRAIASGYWSSDRILCDGGTMPKVIFLIGKKAEKIIPYLALIACISIALGAGLST